MAVLLLLAALALPASARGWGDLGPGGWWAWIWSWVGGKAGPGLLPDGGTWELPTPDAFGPAVSPAALPEKSGPELNPDGSPAQQTGHHVVGSELDPWG